MPHQIDGFLFVGQIVAGLMVLLPFALRDRYQAGQWFCEKQKSVAGGHAQLAPAMFFALLLLGFGSVSAFLLGEALLGSLIVSFDIFLAARLVVVAPRASA